MFIPFGDNGIEASLNQEILGEISFAGAKKRFLSDKPAGWQVCRNRNDNIDYFQMVASIHQSKVLKDFGLALSHRCTFTDYWEL
jgi:hypothetical protein